MDTLGTVETKRISSLADARRGVAAQRDLHQGEGRDRERAKPGAPQVDQQVGREAEQGRTGKSI